MATPLYNAQIPFRVKDQTTCANHKGRQLDHYCEKCNVPVCIKCVSTVHKGHPLCDLGDLTPQAKQDIQTFIKKSENVDLVQIDQYITETDTQLKDNASIFQKLSQQLETQTNKLKQDLDLLTAQTLTRYKQMEEDNTKLLQTYKRNLEMHSTQLKQKVQECKEALQEGLAIHIYNTGCDIHSSAIFPIKPTLGTISFSPNSSTKRHLEQALGEINISSQGRDQRLQVQDPDNEELPTMKSLYEGLKKCGTMGKRIDSPYPHHDDSGRTGGLYPKTDYLSRRIPARRSHNK